MILCSSSSTQAACSASRAADYIADPYAFIHNQWDTGTREIPLSYFFKDSSGVGSCNLNTADCSLTNPNTCEAGSSQWHLPASLEDGVIKRDTSIKEPSKFCILCIDGTETYKTGFYTISVSDKCSGTGSPKFSAVTPPTMIYPYSNDVEVKIAYT